MHAAVACVNRPPVPAGRRGWDSPTPVLLTLAQLRLGIPHAALAVAFGVDRATVIRAIGQIRPLLAGRVFATAAGIRLHTLADVFAYAAAENITLRVDATEIRPPRTPATDHQRHRRDRLRLGHHLAVGQLAEQADQERR